MTRKTGSLLYRQKEQTTKKDMTITSLRLLSHSSERILLKTRTPGLCVYENYLSGYDSGKLLYESIALRGKIDRARSSILGYQPHLLKAPNEPQYRACGIQDQFRMLHCDDFFEQDDQNHAVTHFSSNHNVPLYVSSHLIGAVSKLPAISRLASKSFLDWHFTLNTYSAETNSTGKLAALSFRGERVSAGVVAMVYTLGSHSLFQIKDPKQPKDCETICLLPNSLLTLSGKALSEYEHLVIPLTAKGPSLDLSSTIHRIFLELVCEPIHI